MPTPLRFVRLTGLLAVLLFGHPTTLPAADRAGAADWVRLRRGPSGEALVAVVLNGRAAQAIVDTGSSHTAVTQSIARALGLPIVAKASIQTSLGEVMQPIARLDRLTLAGRTVANLLVSVIDDTAFAGGLGADAVIGQDMLADALLTLDFKGDRLYWHDDATLIAGGIVLGLELESGRFVATVPQQQGVLRLVPDSGAEALILYGAPARLPWRVDAADGVWVDTVSGRRLATSGIVPHLRLGDTVLHNVRAAVLPTRRVGAESLDGLLPLSLFSRVTIDGPGRRLRLEP